MSFLLRVCVLLPALATVAATGCGSSAPTPPGKEAVVREVGELYQMHIQQHKRPPLKVDDVQPYEPGAPVGFVAVQAGDVVVMWGAAMGSGPEAAKTILAYEKNAPAQGGAVLMLDGSVKTLTAEEFKTAPQAKKK
jgi:hypothetical protein